MKARGINGSLKTFKGESPNERMERRQERSGGLAGHAGGMLGLSLWAHMTGSLISAQLCPSNATELPIGCQQTVRLCRKQDEGFLFLFDGRVHLFSEHMSSPQVKRGEALRSEDTDASADGGLGCATVAKHTAQRLASGNVRETTQRGTRHDGRKTNEAARSARRRRFQSR